MIEDPRIDQIRAVLAYVDEHEQPSPYVALHRIRAILDSAPPAPRVWFPGDDLPYDPEKFESVAAIAKDGSVLVSPHHVRTVDGPVVELVEPSPEEWQAAVDRARDARADAEWQHTEGTNP